MKKENRNNMLFINKGLDKNTGEILFEEMAKEYGIDDSGNSMGAIFFDYNKDGQMDLYVLNNEQNKSIPTNYRKKIIDGSAVSNDKLYKNKVINKKMQDRDLLIFQKKSKERTLC